MRVPTGLSYVLGLLGLVTLSKAESICARLFHGYDLIHNNLRCSYLGSEIDSNCRIDITAMEEHLAAADLKNLTHYGYRLCFGCGSRAVSHCSRVAICTKESKCYRQTGQDPGTYSYGCCDSTCSDIQCFSTCEGNFCNGDQSQMDYINMLLSLGQTTTAVPGTGFSDWSTWSTCTAPCGTTSIKLRTRVCLPGRTCMGSTQETAACATDPCTHTEASTVITSPNPASDTEASTVITSPNPASVTVASSSRTMPISTSVPCEDNETGLQGTCTYWQNFDICKPDNAAYLSIAQSHCRKTCGICS